MLSCSLDVLCFVLCAVLIVVIVSRYGMTGHGIVLCWLVYCRLSCWHVVLCDREQMAVLCDVLVGVCCVVRVVWYIMYVVWFVVCGLWCAL